MVFAGSYIFLYIFKKIVISNLQKISQKTDNKIDDAIFDTLGTSDWKLEAAISFFAASKFMQLPGMVSKAIDVAILAVGIFYGIRIVQKIISNLTESYVQKQPKYDPMVIIFVSRFFSYSLWLIGILVITQNLGYDVTALVAGLGVVGIAIALAVQNILSDVFSSISIYFDKPFKTGDFIILGSEMGVVKKIGLKTTRMQALQGEEIVISNKELTESRIHNFGKMKERRVESRFGIVYETPLGKIKKVNEIVKKSIEKLEGARLDRIHFKEFADSSLVFEVVYYLPTGDYNKYMDARQELNYSLVREFGKHKIEFAYPTHKVYLAK